MRKILWIGSAITALSCVVGLGFYLAKWPAANPRLSTTKGTEDSAEKCRAQSRRQ